MDVSKAEIASQLIPVLGDQRDSAGDIERFAESLFEKHSSSVRVHWGLSQSDINLPLQPIVWYRLGYQCMDPSIRLGQTLDFAVGDYYLQDSGSMLALAACEADRPIEVEAPRRLICDLCAAPGGKATALLESIGDGFLLANEPIKSRVAPLAFNLARTGSNRYAISSMDPERLAHQLGGIFDLVVVDAPCSGQALLSKGKQTLSSITIAQVEHSAARARRILQSAFMLLRPGGQLVFSTCTFAERENEAQIDWLIDEFPAIPDPVDRLSPYQSAPRRRSHENSPENACCYRLWPHRDRCAGSFAASVRSDVDVPSVGSFRERKSKGKRRKQKQGTDIELPEAVATMIEAKELRIEEGEVNLWAWPADAPSWVEAISISGPELAYRTGRTWKPSHHLARRRDLQFIDSLEVDEADAWRYLRGESIRCETNGWRVVCHRGRGLGWIKASGGVGKNHLPPAARF
ncbi:methyltransferase RsmF C-terminal domain-like protein [Roseiconus lacunae]|uniref:methyltransferase RsmF C-terminal domain-like protein n=1 Tax=Roseiconus lacunae TaxID=2605694 RepID=UPI0011F12C76|nr:SAM-dependent methyltransferase [Roseiconus lacunae]